MKTLTEMKKILEHVGSRASIPLCLITENEGCIDEYVYDKVTNVQIEMLQKLEYTIKEETVFWYYDVGVAVADEIVGGSVQSIHVTRGYQAATTEFLTAVSRIRVNDVLEQFDSHVWAEYYNIMREEA